MEPMPPFVSPFGILSVVGTPIGNLSDASPRSLETLRSADVILCEDTRVTSKLCSRFDIHVTLERCDENVIEDRIPSVLARLTDGARVAFVSDAGMPCVSDPGQRLVDAALDAGLSVEVVPGPSAVSSAIARAGLPCEHFFFEGFLPRKASERASRLDTIARIPATLVIYESPRRVAATLSGIAAEMPQRRVALVRELTKIHEEAIRGMAPALAAEVAAAGEVRGECVIVVAAPSAEELARREQGLFSSAPSMDLDEAIAEGLSAGTPKSALARRLSQEYSTDRATVYDAIVAASKASR